VRALVIDDSRAMRMILAKMLRELGFEVSEAGHGQEGLERLRSQSNVDLVTVDWNMPVMNGLEFVTAVRADHANDSTQLMMVTTETELHQISKALESGANEYVMKPFTRDVIEDKLRLLKLTA